MSIYKLYLDDRREPWHTYKTCGHRDWVVVRSYDKFVDCIVENGLPFVVSFDHDLADEHYLPEVPQSAYKEKTGMDCAKWLIDYCMDNNLKLPAFNVHSANPAGRENIRSILSNFSRFQEENQ